MPDDVIADPAFARRARAGRDDNVGRSKVFDLLDAHLVVAEHLDRPARIDLAELLDKVVGERVVIIDQDDHCRPSIVRETRAKKQPPRVPWRLRAMGFRPGGSRVWVGRNMRAKLYVAFLFPFS